MTHPSSPDHNGEPLSQLPTTHRSRHDDDIDAGSGSIQRSRSQTSGLQRRGSAASEMAEETGLQQPSETEGPRRSLSLSDQAIEENALQSRLKTLDEQERQQAPPPPSEELPTEQQRRPPAGPYEPSAQLEQPSPPERVPSAAAPSDVSVEVAPPLSRIATNLYTISYLIFFSFFGTLARIGIRALTTYPGAPASTGILWANVGGCLLMGFLSEDQNLFRQEWGRRSHDNETTHAKQQGTSQAAAHGIDQSEPGKDPSQALSQHKQVKKTIPLYIGLSTGFCGSFTSFSSFMSDTFLALSNDLSNPNTAAILHRNAGYSVMAVLGVIIYTIACSFSALIFGCHLAFALDKLLPTLPFRFTRYILDRTIIFLALGCWLGSIFLAIWPPYRHSHDSQVLHNDHWRSRVLFSLIFSPIGCLLRFYMSLLMNPLVPSFPMGTFAVNIFGSLVYAMCYGLQHASGIAGLSASRATAAAITYRLSTSCQVLQGFMDGFCGCLTTVSTWVVELQSLDLKFAYRYGLVSLVTGVCCMVIVCGSLKWTHGFDTPAC